MGFEKYNDFILMDVVINHCESDEKLNPTLYVETIFYIWREPLNAATSIVLTLDNNFANLSIGESISIKIGVVQSEFSNSIKVGEVLNWGGLQNKLGLIKIHKIIPPLRSIPNFKPKTKTLYRPVNQIELDLIAKSNYTKFPPRKEEQPFFYPVLTEDYASRIAKKWNVPAYGAGYVTKFEVREDFLETYEIHNVGGAGIDEYWIPSEDLELFNMCILGKIVVIKKYLL